MIKHIVMWKMKDAEGRSARENAAYVKGRLEQLPPLIHQIRRLEAQVDSTADENNYHLLLVAEFDSIAALEAYKVHPDHRQVGAYVAKVSAARSCVDYEF